MKGKNRTRLLSALLSGLAALELALGMDYIAVLSGSKLRSYIFVAFFAVAAGVFFFIPCLNNKRRGIIIGAVTAAMLLAFASSVVCLNIARRTGGYRSEDDGKKELYAGRRVMMIVPHPDDDINVLGGVMQEYTRYGSELYIVLTTNGDYYDNAEIRINEALAHCDKTGVPRENLILLGYGDCWNADGPHIYNAEQGEKLTSRCGRTTTYGVAGVGCFNGEKDYTADNYLKDIEDVISEYKPDILFVNDFDYHEDHRATSMAFEKAIGRILKSDTEYRPTVYKAYAYGGAWYAAEDFYSLNAQHVGNVYLNDRTFCYEIYSWEDRVRFPVWGGGLARFISQSGDYGSLLIYKSQMATRQIFGMGNSDKVFWERRTDSLCLNADIEVSSGEKGFLNDFMLLESNNVKDYGHNPFDGVWQTEKGDADRRAEVKLAEPSDISEIILYDNPSPDDNIKNAAILFDDGTVVYTGELNKTGYATTIPVHKERVRSFTVTLIDTEGEEAGLTELEAFEDKREIKDSFIKIADENENFVYDYFIEQDGEQDFMLYRYGELPEVGEENYLISCDGGMGRAELCGNTIRVSCPEGESCEVTIMSRDGRFSDSAVFRNPTRAQRSFLSFCQRFEATLYQRSVQNRLVAVRLGRRLLRQYE